MSRTKHTNLRADLQLKAIEILNCSITSPAAINSSVNNFSFNVNLESKIDGDNKLIFVIVNVEILDEEQRYVLGSLSVSCVYDVFNFDEIIKLTSSGTVEVPQPMADILSSTSISTVRGVMFSTFKGTLLHNAILPLVDPALHRTVSK